MFEINQPRARDWAIPLMVGVVLFVWASTRTAPTTFSQIVMGLSAVFGLWTAGNAFHHVFAVVNDLWTRKRESDYKFTTNFLAETLGRMTEFQVKALRAGRGVIEIIPTDSGPVEKVHGTNVYLYAAWYILTRSDDRRVYPINNFKTETYHLDVMGDHAIDDYTQAREMHHWLWQIGAGEWGRGNTSMSWVTGWNPEKVMKGLGLDRETYEE